MSGRPKEGSSPSRSSPWRRATRKGGPDFTNAEEPGRAEALICRFNSLLAASVPVASGIFGAMMEVASVNDGPVTIILEKAKDDLG
jgi:D-tyrosyl-tRNA(Tyr) deacylase